MDEEIKEGDKVVFRKLGCMSNEKLGTVVGINEKEKIVAVKRLFKIYIVRWLVDYVVVYKRSKK